MGDHMNHRTLWLAAAAALVFIIAGCASTELAMYDFYSLNMSVDVRVSPDAQVDASYNVVIDAENPMRTALSIGSNLAMANQVSVAEEKLYGALRHTDMRTIVDEELSDFVEATLGVRTVDERRSADLNLMVDIESYGIDVGGIGSGIEFEISAIATLWDAATGDRIWRTREYVSEPASPEVFGLPPVAGNVLSAVALAELTEEEIAKGLDRLARDAAWDIGLELEHDIYRARRRR